MITHRPTNDLLFDYATGSLPEPVSLAIAAHAALCPQSLEQVRRFEAVGGALLDTTEPADLSGDALDRVLAMIDAPASENGTPAPPDARTRALVPSPLWPYLKDGIDSLPWRRRGRKVESAPVDIRSDSHIVRFLRIRAGSPVPVHTHKGQELTLVLSGGYSDGDAHFERGDLQIADPSINHRPMADPGEDCLCFVVLEAPIRLTGAIGRLANPFVRL